MSGVDWKETRCLLSGPDVERVLDRLAEQIRQAHPSLQDVALVGIHTGGVPIAKRLKNRLDINQGANVPLGMIDITLYRDDALEGLPSPVVGQTDFPFRVTGSRIILVDDVLYTGRTIRAALDAIIDFGRPRVIELLVVADRGHREFPIQPDFVGIVAETGRDESVHLFLTETGAAVDRLAVHSPCEPE
jgi:pyrimidine operon attenuation protein/uracil phosphoribosyltransferase